MTEPVGVETELVLDGPAERVKEHVGTALSTAAMLAVSGGVGWGLFAVLGPWAVAIGGAVLGVLVMISDAARAPKPLPEAEPDRRPVALPGPTDPGNVHANGPGVKR